MGLEDSLNSSTSIEGPDATDKRELSAKVFVAEQDVLLLTYIKVPVRHTE